MAAPVLTGTPVALALGTSATPGAQSVTVPADAQAVVVLYRTYSAGGSSLSLGSSFAGTFSYDQTTGAGEHTGVAWALVSATGSQTLTPTWTNAPAEGPIFLVAFVRDISTSDWYRASGQQVFNSTGTAASVSIASATDDLVMALDSQYDAGNAIPSNPTGWTSRQTQGVNSEGGRLRTADAPGASTTTATSQSTNYSGIAAISIKAAAAPSGAVFDGAIFSAPPFDTGAGGFSGATANGTTLNVTASLIGGSVSAASQVSGQTLTATASLIAGTASASSSATVNGTTLTATASLIAGAASGTASANVSGVTLTATTSLTAGSLAAASSVSGLTLTATASLLAGTAAGGSASTVNGQTLTVSASIIAGSLAADSLVSGVTLSGGAVSLIPGTVAAASSVSGTTFTATTAFFPGSASAGSSGATVNGQDLTTTVFFLAGFADNASLPRFPVRDRARNIVPRKYK